MKLFTFSTLLLFTSLTFSQESETVVENFDNADRGWPTGSWEKKFAEIKDGQFTFHNKDEEYVNGSFIELSVNRDFDYSYEIKIKQTEGSPNKYFSLVLGFVDWKNYASVSFTSSGYVKADEEYQGKEYKMFEKIKVDSTIMNGMGEWNILKFEQKGDNSYIYINGNKVGDCTSFDFYGQIFGFTAGSEQKLVIDYIKVTRKSQKINLVQDATIDKELTNLGANVNSKYSELVPIISSDSKTLYYAIQNNPDLNIGDELLPDAVYSTKSSNGEWSKPKHLGKNINNKSVDYVISMSPDENAALFGGSYSLNDTLRYGISYGVKRNGEWQIPKKVEFEEHVKYRALSEYSLASDGLVMLSSIHPKGSWGMNDICVSFLQENGIWTAPKNLGHTINTYAKEISPYLAADGKTLFFSSYGHPGYGGTDIFMSKRLDDTWINWSKPLNVGPVINSKNFDAFLMIDAQGEFAYMVSSNNSLGKEDLYKVKIGEGIRPDVLNLISGKVYNTKTNEEIEADIEYEDLTNGKKMGFAYSTTEDGFKITLPKGKKYGFRASAEGFISVSSNLDLTNITKYGEKEVKLYLVPIEKGQSLTLNNLFFATGKSNLQKESFPELNRLADLMKESSDLKIEISGHTDSSGDKKKNLTLSESRAKAVYDYLISKGVSSSNMKSIGLGQSKPIASNETTAGKKKNRRVELKIQ